MRTLIGTSGYSYPPWKGRFYPKDLPARQFLAYYASKFPTVEINNTFYKLPAAEQVAGWAAGVGRDFVFAVKAPQRITHMRRLQDGSAPLVGELVDVVAALGKKRGPILFQLPPNMKADVPRLEAFLSSLPPRLRVAFEFRHASWFSDETWRALGDAGAALCIADTDDLETPLEATAKWGYLRLRREDYSKADIRKWAKRISAQKWDTAFVYFKHEDTAKGPAFAAQLQAVLDS